MSQQEVPPSRWRNMRRMAWLSILCALVLFPIAVMLAPKLIDIAVPFYSLCGSIIVVGYMGVSGAADAWGFQNSKGNNNCEHPRWRENDEGFKP